MIDQDTHIALMHYDNMPDEFLDEFCANVNTDSINFSRISRPEPGPQMGLEWLAFPAIALILLKPYYDGFMGEAGKHHHQILRRAVKSLWEKYFSEERKIRFVMVTASGEKKLKFSMLFAIYAVDKNGHMIKLLIRESCSREEYFSAIDSFLDFVESYQSDETTENQATFLDLEKDKKKITLLEYDIKSKSLRVVNPGKDSDSA